MKLLIKLRDDELETAQNVWGNCFPRRPIVSRWEKPVVVLGLSVALVYRSLYYIYPSRWDALLLGALLAIASFVLMYALLWEGLLLAHWRRFTGPIKRKATISGDGVQIPGLWNSRLVRWDALDRVAEHEDLYALFAGKDIVVVPYRVFSDKSKWSQFTDCLWETKKKQNNIDGDVE